MMFTDVINGYASVVRLYKRAKKVIYLLKLLCWIAFTADILLWVWYFNLHRPIFMKESPRSMLQASGNYSPGTSRILLTKAFRKNS